MRSDQPCPLCPARPAAALLDPRPGDAIAPASWRDCLRRCQAMRTGALERPDQPHGAVRRPPDERPGGGPGRGHRDARPGPERAEPGQQEGQVRVQHLGGRPDLDGLQVPPRVRANCWASCGGRGLPIPDRCLTGPKRCSSGASRSRWTGRTTSGDGELRERLESIADPPGRGPEVEDRAGHRDRPGRVRDRHRRGEAPERDGRKGDGVWRVGPLLPGGRSDRLLGSDEGLRLLRVGPELAVRPRTRRRAAPALHPGLPGARQPVPSGREPRFLRPFEAYLPADGTARFQKLGWNTLLGAIEEPQLVRPVHRGQGL